MTVPETVSLKRDEPSVSQEPIVSSTENLEAKAAEVVQVEIPPIEVLATIKPNSHDYDSEICFQPLATNWLVFERRKWHVLNAIVGLSLVFGWLINGVLIHQQFDFWQWILLIMIAVLMAGLMWAASFFPSRSFKMTSWRSLPHGFEIHRGIWWRHRIFIPRDRIQHTDVNQGPFEHLYGLATLVVNTGGTHAPSITIEGLEMQQAEALREQLSRRDPDRTIKSQGMV